MGASELFPLACFSGVTWLFGWLSSPSATPSAPSRSHLQFHQWSLSGQEPVAAAIIATPGVAARLNVRVC